MSFQTVEQLQATVAEQALEIKRLTGCLAKANANHKHFEREWYLSGDQIATLTAAIKRAYVEGFGDGWEVYEEGLSEGVERDLCWEHSETRAALQPKEGNP